MARMVNQDTEKSIKITISREEARTTSSSLVSKTAGSHKVLRVVAAVVVVNLTKANVPKACQTSQFMPSSSSTKFQLINRDLCHKSLNKLLWPHPMLILTSGYSSLL